MLLAVIACAGVGVATYAITYAVTRFITEVSEEKRYTKILRETETFHRGCREKVEERAVEMEAELRRQLVAYQSVVDTRGSRIQELEQGNQALGLELHEVIADRDKNWLHRGADGRIEKKHGA